MRQGPLQCSAHAASTVATRMAARPATRAVPGAWWAGTATALTGGTTLGTRTPTCGRPGRLLRSRGRSPRTMAVATSTASANCPTAPGPSTRARCSQQTPLPFFGTTSWIGYDEGVKNPQTGGTGGRASFTNMKTSTGTVPAGSAWMRNPIPGCTNPAEPRKNGNNGLCTGPQFTPVMKRLYGFSCSGIYSQFKFPCHHIIDKIQVPTHLEDGDYVVSLRYDCEQTSQVWNSCGDVRIQGKAPLPDLYGCTNNQCVPDPNGIPKETCEAVCHQ